MSLSRLIADIAMGWVQDPVHFPVVVPAEAAAPCRCCASSDLVLQSAATVWPHESLHRLIAPIEEIVETAVEAYVAEDRAHVAHIDAYRSRLRTTARGIIDHALMHRKAWLTQLAS